MASPMTSRMTDSQVKAVLSDLQALALTMVAEAGGDVAEGRSSVEERIAVGCVVRNRLLTPGRFGRTWRAVCLQQAQFSCWWQWGGLKNYERTLRLARAAVGGHLAAEPEAALVRESEFLADGIMRGLVLDRVQGATHYYAPAAMVPRGSVPRWATELIPLAHVGGHVFFLEPKPKPLR